MWLILLPLDVPTLTTSRLPKRSWQSEILVAKGGTMWARNGRWILPEMPDFHVAFRNLLHAANLRHGTDGFTSPPKEGVLRIFSPWKIRQLRPGLNPWTWVPKASTLPLDHQSCCNLRFYCKYTATSGICHYWSLAEKAGRMPFKEVFNGLQSRFMSVLPFVVTPIFNEMHK